MLATMRVRGLPWQAIPSVLAWRAEVPKPVRHVFLCVCDHWEPKWRRPTTEVERQRVERWRVEYPRSVEGLADSGGRPPQHTFFYPEEEYEPEYLDALVELRDRGLGDVDIHLHHDRDTSAALRDKLERFRDMLFYRHGLLSRDSTGQITYGFIHGNWALDNSHPQGRWCGVNDELTILRETGCYADFTMPSAPAFCQTTTVNTIYYAEDDPARPKSHDRGWPARVGKSPQPDRLLMIQGPLTTDWSSRKWGILPRIENGDLTAGRPPTLHRFLLWCTANVHVVGQKSWLFIKLHTHGAQEDNAAMLLGEPMRRFHQSLAEWARRCDTWKYWYVTAREMAQLVHQAEAGQLEPIGPAAAPDKRSTIQGRDTCV
jgi:hypothetical protein